MCVRARERGGRVQTVIADMEKKSSIEDYYLNYNWTDSNPTYTTHTRTYVYTI